MSSFAELAQSIQLALKALAMYTQAHPRCQATLAELHAAVTRWLEAQPSLHIAATNGKLFVNGSPFEGNNLHVNALVRQLAERQISGLVIQRSVAADELGEMLRILTLKPAKLEELGGVAQVMEECGLRHISLSQTQYREVREGEELQEDAAPVPEDPERTAARLLQEAAAMVARWKECLSDAPVRSLPPGSPGGAAPADLRGVAPVAEDMGWGNGFPTAPQVESLRQAMYAIPAGRVMNILAGLDSLPELPTSLRMGFHGLAPELLGRAATGLLEAGGSWAELRDTLLSVLRRSPNRQALASSLANVLFAQGLSEEQIAELFRHMDWEAQGLDERIRRAREGETFWELDLQQRLDFLYSLLTEGHLEAFLEFLERVLSALRQDAPALREAAARTAAGIAEWVQEPDFPAEGEGALLQALAAHFGWEPLPPLLRVSGQALQTLLVAFVQRGELQAATGLVQDLSGLCAFLEEDQAWRMEALEQLKGRLGDAEVLDQALEALYGASTERILTELVPFFELAGPAAAQHLVAALGDEPDRRRRGRLLEVIRTLGATALPALQEGLHASAWYLVRNTLNLLAEMGDASLLDEVVPCLEHPDLRVKRAAIRALWKLGGPAAAAPILAVFPRLDPDSQVEAIFGLGQIQAPEAVEAFAVRIVDRGTPERLRGKMIEALGHIGHAGALPALLEVVRRRSRLFSSGEPLELRLAAARAVLDLRSPSGLAELRRLVDGEPKGAERDAFLRLIQDPTA